MPPSEFHDLLDAAMAGIAEWENQWPAFERDASLNVPPQRARAAIAELTQRLRNNYPFFHPDYAGQMLKPPHPIALAAYAAAMRINPNNHALDGGPATAELEREAVEQIAEMFGYDRHSLGHLTSSGTLANLEALWVARQLRPGAAVAFSSEAHYTHARMCELLGLKTRVIGVDRYGRMDIDELAALSQSANIGTVVVTAGTTATGAVDRIDLVVRLAREHGWRVHTDAAYGGFFAIVAGLPEARIDPDPWRALRECDSIVVDPHKHGLQPYGCGCVVFRDRAVAALYRHESPYTYYTKPSDATSQHLGEISLECSRAGAAAAALWTTLRCFPLERDGLGRVLLKCREAALAAYERAQSGGKFMPVVAPELDIVTLLPVAGGERINASAVSARTDAVFEACMTDSEEPIYVAKWQVPEALGRLALDNVAWDAPHCTALRSVMMKPEHAAQARRIVERLEFHLTRV
jgi:glutamate/tyrosine decarboxylase-like PLP-dependent enzyme